MQSNPSETIVNVRSTVHPTCQVAGNEPVTPDVRHAVIVVNRLLRSTAPDDDVVHDRLLRAACVLKASRSTETAFASGRPVDVAFRLASRIVRKLGFWNAG